MISKEEAREWQSADQPKHAQGNLVPKRHPSSQKFHDLCDAMKAMHDKKQQDYGRANDPFANVRASEDFGVAGWAGCMIRANDKMRRIQKAAQGGTLSNEGVEDSLMDLAVYSIIALVLYREMFAENVHVTVESRAVRMQDVGVVTVTDAQDCRCGACEDKRRGY